MLKVKKVKSYFCEYCNNGFTTQQGYSRHINHNKKCIQNRDTKSSSTQDDIQKLKDKIHTLENSGETPHERDIRILSEELRIVKDLNKKLESDIQVYKPFYNKYMSSGVEGLVYYDRIEFSDNLLKNLCEKYDLGKLDFNVNMVYYIHGFVTEFWKLTDIKEGVYKYRNKTGDIVVDDKLKYLYSIVSPVFYGMYSSYISDLRVSGDKYTEHENRYFDMITNENAHIDFYNRMITIDDVKMQNIRRRDYQHLVDLIQK
jgi:hypothetical protein